MALTLVEASKLSNDVLLTGVVETIIKDSPILQSLPFIEIQGNRASRPHLVSTVVLPVGCQYSIRIWESGERQTTSAECRRRSANPPPRK